LFKDFSELHLKAPDQFDAVWVAARQAAVPLFVVLGDHKPLELHFRDDLRLNTQEPPLVDGFLHRRSLTTIVAASNMSKTFLAIYLSNCLAAGVHWFGNEVEQCAVCYAAAEAQSRIIPRFLAYKDLPAGLPLAVITTSINLAAVGAPDVATLIQNIKEAEQERGIKFGLVVIDTLARAMPGGDDSKSGDMSAVIANCDEIIAKTGATVLLIHHLGKDESAGSRGSSALPAAVDTEIRISKRQDGTFQARTTKQRDLPESKVLVWKLEPVTVGHYEDGREITSCIVVELEVEAEANSKGGRPVKLTDNDAIVLDALKQAIVNDGHKLTPSRHVPDGVIGVRYDLWQRYHDQVSPAGDDKNREARSRRFERGVAKLQRLEIAKVYGDVAWLVESPT
jgi:hypothetical protein